MSSLAEELNIRGPKGNSPKYVVLLIMHASVVWMIAHFPEASNRYFLFSVPLGAVSFISGIWAIKAPNPVVKVWFSIAGSALLALLAYRSLVFVAPALTTAIAILMIAVFGAVHSLPVWSSRAASLVSDELYEPKTWFGKVILRAIFFLAPFAVIGGVSLGRVAAASDNKFLILIMGILFGGVAYSIPFIDRSRYSTKRMSKRIGSR
jgi:hypothetical protein